MINIQRTLKAFSFSPKVASAIRVKRRVRSLPSALRLLPFPLFHLNHEPEN